MPGSLLGLLAASGLTHMPARTWILQASLERLQEDVPASSAVGRALRRWRRRRSISGPVLVGLPALIHDLLSTGALLAQRDRHHPVFGVSSIWIEEHLPLLAGLTEKERDALAESAQDAVARLKRVSNTPATAGSAKSPTTTSGTARRHTLTR